MPAKPLDPAVLQRALVLLEAHNGNTTHAANAAGVSRGTFAHHCREAKRRIVETRESSTLTVPVTVDEAWRWWDGYVGRSTALRTSQTKPKKGRQRYVCISDLHSPFHDPRAVAEVITREAKTTDRLIIAGDLGDGYSISSFLKYDHVPIQDELATTDALLEQLASSFASVILEEGNHDGPRADKRLRERLTNDQMRYIEYLTGGNLSAISLMAKRHKNVTMGGHEVGRFKMGWLTQIGDVLVAHREMFSRIPGNTLRSGDEWLTDMHDALELRPWRILLHAHTHQLMWTPWKNNRLLVETGCLCQIHGYHLTAKTGGRPQRLGYVTFEQTDGVTDIESVRPVWLDDAVRQLRQSA
jgi:hypothetical protein